MPICQLFISIVIFFSKLRPVVALNRVWTNVHRLAKRFKTIYLVLQKTSPYIYISLLYKIEDSVHEKSSEKPAANDTLIDPALKFVIALRHNPFHRLPCELQFISLLFVLKLTRLLKDQRHIFLVYESLNFYMSVEKRKLYL